MQAGEINAVAGRNILSQCRREMLIMSMKNYGRLHAMQQNGNATNVENQTPEQSAAWKEPDHVCPSFLSPSCLFCLSVRLSVPVLSVSSPVGRYAKQQQ